MANNLKALGAEFIGKVDKIRMKRSECIEIEHQERVAIVWLNKPENKNRLNRVMIDSLRSTVNSLDHHMGTGAVVLAARGDVFCAGGDMGDYTTMSVGEIREFWKSFIGLYIDMHEFTKPLIAAVDGPVEGGGFTLFDTVDLAVATPQATFSAPEVQVGLAPIIVTVAVGRCLGRRKAMELFLTGSALSAEEAMQLGLVNRLVPTGQAVAEAIALARSMCNHNPLAVSLCKRTYRSCFSRDYRDNLEHALDILISMLKSDDGLESAKARKERRMPTWTGR